MCETKLTVHRLHNFLRELVQDGKGDYTIATWIPDTSGATARDLIADKLVIDDELSFVVFHYSKAPIT
jgi:hypothetical protein